MSYIAQKPLNVRLRNLNVDLGLLGKMHGLTSNIIYIQVDTQFR